jgi:hypothetical protein
MGRLGRGAGALKFHVLTAVSRPYNLTAVGSSLATAVKRAGVHEVQWHLRFDPARQHVGGQELKNRMLDDIADGWVVILDDDTVMHKQFFPRVVSALKRNPGCAAVVVSQLRTSGEVLVAHPDNAVVGGIDAGQVVIRRDVIGEHRLPPTYAGDGVWLEKILFGRSDVVYMTDVLSLHNRLSGIDVSEPPERMRA